MTDFPWLQRYVDGSIQLLSHSFVSLLERYLGIPIQRDYTVQIVNATSNTTFDEVDVFYKRAGLPGIVFLTQPHVTPGQVHYFDLGACSQMESYVVGFFVGEDLVAQIPPEGDGNMTPTRASQFKPSDVYPCADGWAIGD